MSAPRIIAENLGKRFPRRAQTRPLSWRNLLHRPFTRAPASPFWALRDVSFTVRPGEMLGVIGANGAGKSTLLRLLGGIGRPTTGRVQVSGRIGALLELGGGFVGDLTGRENAILAGVVAGLLRVEIEALLPRIVAFAELEHCIDDLLHTYSTGMGMRLAFAVAVHTSPEILLVDEFLSVGDLAFQGRCRERIASLRRGGCAVVMVSHSMDQVRETCDRALWLRQGEPVAFDSTAAVTRVYETEMRNATLARTPDAPPTTTAGSIELRPRENRLGSREVEIVRVALRPGPAISSGDPLLVEIEVIAHRPVRHPIVAVSVTTQDGALCLDTNTEKAGVAIDTVTGKTTVQFALDRLEIMAGSYFVNVGIFEENWSHAYDYHWHAYPLTVDGAPGHKALLAPPTRWKIEHLT